MPKLSSLKAKEIEKILLENGFVIKRQTGSHKIFYNPKTQKTTVVPVHTKVIPRGTVQSIIRQSDLQKEKFIK